MDSRWTIGTGVVILGVLLSAAAPATTERSDPNFLAWQTCMDKSDSTNPAWGECGRTLVQSEDSRLNRAWQRIYPRLEPASKAALLAEERSWISFRDKSCEYYKSGDYGREGQVVHWPLCRAQVISERADELEALYEQTFQDERR